MEMTFTDGVTKYGERDKYSQDEYIVQFNKYIRMPNFDRLYKSISNPEFVSNLDEFVAKRINEIKSMRISDEEKERQIEELKKINLYPLSRFKSIFDKFETFHEFYSFFNNHNLWEVSDKIFRFPNLKDKVLGQLNDIGLNKEQIDTMCRFMNLIKNRFDGDPGVMGFHIYPQLLQIMDTGMDREKGEMKFYLNAGIDTYKVAQLFQQKCEQAKLNYYFKVVNAVKDYEFRRTDKMCIYTEFKNAKKFLEIIREIKVENPDINFQQPPILTGRIDGFVGTGMDNVKGKNSYNGIMSKVCYDAVTSTFQNISREQIPALIDRHPEILYKLKEKIKQRAKEMGLDPEKICVAPEIRYKLEIQDKQDLLNFLSKFRSSYKRLEVNEQYNKRIDREKSDILYVAKYINDYKANRINHEYFLDLKPEIVNKTTGKMDFSKNQIDGLFRMLNAVGILTVGNPQYFMDFCTSPEIKKLLGQMQQSQEIQNMIKYAEIAKEQGEQGRTNLRGATPAERDRILAREAFVRRQKKGYSDKEIFNIITDSYHINGGYANEEDLALAKIYYRRRGIPIQACRRESNGMYKLYIADNSPKGDEVRY